MIGPTLEATILFKFYVLTGLMFLLSLSVYFLLRRRLPGLAWHQGGLVKTDKIAWVDLGGLAFLWFIYFANLAGPVFSPKEVVPESEVELSAGKLAIGVLLSGILVFLPLGLISLRGNILEILGLRWKKWPWLFLIAPASIVFILILMAGLMQAGYEKWIVSIFPTAERQESVKMLMESDDHNLVAVMVIAAVVVAPLVEEVIFRGYIYAVAKRFTGRLFGMLFSAAVFALVHNNIMGLVPLFLLALILVISYEWSGSLWMPISIHMLFNSLTVVATLYARSMPPTDLVTP